MIRVPFDQLSGTCYLEFQPHEYLGQVWLKNSLYYTEDDFHRLFNTPLMQAITGFDYYEFFDIHAPGFARLEKQLLEHCVANEFSDLSRSEIDFFIQWGQAAIAKTGAIAYIGM